MQERHVNTCSGGRRKINNLRTHGPPYARGRSRWSLPLGGLQSVVPDIVSVVPDIVVYLGALCGRETERTCKHKHLEYTRSDKTFWRFFLARFHPITVLFEIPF